MSTVYIIYGVQLRNWNWIGADVRSNTKFPNIIDVVGGEAVLLMLGAVIVILPRLFSVWWCRLVLLLILLSIPFIWCFGKKRVGSNWTTALCFIAYGLVQGDQLPLILLFDGWDGSSVILPPHWHTFSIELFPKSTVYHDKTLWILVQDEVNYHRRHHEERNYN